MLCIFRTFGFAQQEIELCVIEINGIAVFVFKDALAANGLYYAAWTAGNSEPYTAVYPVDCVYTKDELDTIDMYKPDFESTVSEQEGLWLKEGGPSDAEWENYLTTLKESCGMDELLKVYQDAYDRYAAAESGNSADSGDSEAE